MAGTLAHVAFDIETNGLDATDEVTVVGFELELGCRVFYQTSGRDTDANAVEMAVQDQTGVHVEVSAHQSERVLLEAVSAFVATRLQSADLDTAYEILCAGDAGASDPFDDSGEAVAAFADGRFEAVVLRNVADLRRTGQLSSLAQRYCSKSDFQLKSLTPTVDSTD
jgi:hypothetical protein